MHLLYLCIDGHLVVPPARGCKHQLLLLRQFAQHSRLLIHLLPKRKEILQKLTPHGWLLGDVFDHFLLSYPEDEPTRNRDSYCHMALNL